MPGPIAFDPIITPTLEMAADGVAAFKQVATTTDANFAKIAGYQFGSYLSAQQHYVSMETDPWQQRPPHYHTAMNAWQTISSSLLPATSIPTNGGMRAFLLEVGGQVYNNDGGAIFYGVKATGTPALGAAYDPEMSCIAVSSGQVEATRLSLIPIVTPGTPVLFTPMTFANTPDNFTRFAYYRILTLTEAS
jgi:hypothetical protein